MIYNDIHKYLTAFDTDIFELDHDVNAKKTSLENICLPYLLYFAIFPIRDLYNEAELSLNEIDGNGVQVETKNEKFAVMCTRSP